MRDRIIFLSLATLLVAFGVSLAAQAKEAASETTELQTLNFEKTASKVDVTRIVQARALGLPDQASQQEIENEFCRLETVFLAKRCGLNTDLPYLELCRLLTQRTVQDQKRALGLPESASSDDLNKAQASFQALKDQVIRKGNQALAKLPLNKTTERDHLLASINEKVDQLDRQYLARQYGLPSNTTDKELQLYRSKEARAAIANQYGLADNLTDEQACAILQIANRLRQRQIAIAILKETQSVSDLALHRKMTILAKYIDNTHTESRGHDILESAFSTIQFYAVKAPVSLLDINKEKVCKK